MDEVVLVEGELIEFHFFSEIVDSFVDHEGFWLSSSSSSWMACSRYSWPASTIFCRRSGSTSLSGRRLMRARKRWQKSTFCFPGEMWAIWTKTSKELGSTQLASVSSRIFLANRSELVDSGWVMVIQMQVGSCRGHACLGEGDRYRF